MDEPSRPDLECKRDIQAYLKAYTADGGTVILTSHENGGAGPVYQYVRLKGRSSD